MTATPGPGWRRSPPASTWRPRRRPGSSTERSSPGWSSAARRPPTFRRADLRLTEAGWALHERARDFRAAYLGTVLMDWPTDSIGALAELVDRFADAVADTPPTPDEGDDT